MNSWEVILDVMVLGGLYLFGLWCRILDGGWVIILFYIFYFVFEQDDMEVEFVLVSVGDVKVIFKQINQIFV